MAAAAKANGGASGEIEGLPIGVDDFVIAFDANGSVVVDRNLC